VREKEELCKVLFVLLIAVERSVFFLLRAYPEQLMRLELGAHLIFKGFILMSNFSAALLMRGYCACKVYGASRGIRERERAQEAAGNPQYAAIFFRRKQPLGAAPVHNKEEIFTCR
jgi:hypothetical protein